MQTPANPRLPTLFIVGDTTVRGNSPTSASAGPLFDLFNPALINVVDRTLDHHTTRSYLDEGDWRQTLALVRSGDIVLFQFAESDPSLTADTVRVPGTLPGIGDEIREVPGAGTGKPEIVHTYGWYLRLYVVETIARGAIPILSSPAPLPPGSQTPIPQTASAPDSHGNWAQAIAIQQRVAYLDLEAAARALTPTDSTPGTLDAQAIVAALKGLPNDPLAGYFSSAAASIKPFANPQLPRDANRRSPDLPADLPARPQGTSSF